MTDISLPGRHQGGHKYQWTSKQTRRGSSPASLASEANKTPREKERREDGNTHLSMCHFESRMHQEEIWKCVLATNPQVTLQARVWKTIKLKTFYQSTQPSARPADCAKLGLFPRWEFWNCEYTNFRNSSFPSSCRVSYCFIRHTRRALSAGCDVAGLPANHTEYPGGRADYSPEGTQSPIQTRIVVWIPHCHCPVLSI